MTSRSKDQKPDAVSLTKRRPQAFAKFNPRLFLTHRRAILLPPELHRIFFPKEENERLRCLCLSQSPAEHFSYILSSLLYFLFAKFFGQCLDLFYVLFLHSGHYFYIILCPGDIFALLKHTFHHFRCGRCPASVFDQTDGAVLEAALCQTVDEILHERVNACIVVSVARTSLL